MKKEQILKRLSSYVLCSDLFNEIEAIVREAVEAERTRHKVVEKDFLRQLDELSQRNYELSHSPTIRAKGLALIQAKLVAAQKCHVNAVQALIADALDELDAVARSQPVAVPEAVMQALARMETPLDNSVLSGATADADARSMKAIGDFIRSLASAQKPVAVPKGFGDIALARQQALIDAANVAEFHSVRKDDTAHLIAGSIRKLAVAPKPEQQQCDRVCKGSWSLGTACGKCSRCLTTKPEKQEIK